MSNNSIPGQSHNINAEQAVIASALMDSDQLHDLLAVLSSNDFFDPLLAAVFKSIEQLFEEQKSIDLFTVSDRLATNDKFQQLGGSTFLAQLISTIPSAAIASSVADIVKSKSIRRKVAKVGTSLVNLSVDENQEAAELIQEAEKQLSKLADNATQTEWVQLFDACDKRFNDYSEAFESDDPSAFAGVATGFVDLDAILGGLLPGHLMVLAARPSMGKTALAMNFARNAAVEKQNVVGVFSLEMSREQLIDRLVAGELGVESRKLTRGTVTESEFEQLGGVMDYLRDLPIFIDDRAKNVAEISSKARQLKRKVGLDLLVIDYLQLLEASGSTARDNRLQQISEITRRLKQLGRELGCPIVLLSQLNRECEKRNPPIPVEADLRESGSIEQDADSILMLYREGRYNEDCDRPTITDVLVRKHRQGPTGRIELDFDPERVRFSSVSYSHVQQ